MKIIRMLFLATAIIVASVHGLKAEGNDELVQKLGLQLHEVAVHCADTDGADKFAAFVAQINGSGIAATPAQFLAVLNFANDDNRTADEIASALFEETKSRPYAFFVSWVKDHRDAVTELL